MKINALIGGTLVFAAGLWSCTSKTCNENTSEVNDLIQKDIEIKYEHKLTIPEGTEVLKTFDYPAFVAELFKKTKSGAYTVYDAQNLAKKLSAAEVGEILNTHLDTTKEINVKTFDTVVNVKRDSVSLNQIERLVFTEKWYFNKARFVMEKKVINYSPVQLYYKGAVDSLGEKDMVKKMLFSYKYNDSVRKPFDQLQLLATDVTYEFDLYNSKVPEWLTAINPTAFVNLILSKVIDEKYPVYDFFDRKKQLGVGEVKENLGATVEHYLYDNEKTGKVDTVEVVGNIYPDEIMSLIFVEDWYVDKANGCIYKKVKSIAPVRQYYRSYENGDEDLVKKIAFIVNLK